ncbi:MAG: lipopolysaccharide biosynthesis protein [Sumerlaeia bacterium]
MEQHQNRKLVSDTTKVTGAVGLAYLINLIGGLFIAHILGASRYGVWKAVQLVMEYTAYSNLGSNHGIDRQCPALVSANQNSQYKRLLSTSITFSLILSGLFSLIFFLLSLHSTSQDWRIAFAGLGFLIIFQQLFINGDSALGAEKKFGRKSFLLLLQTAARVILSIIFGYAFGLGGVVSVFVVVLAVCAVLQLRSLRISWTFQLSKPLLRRLIFSGSSITFLVLCERMILNADRIAVGFALGEKAFGIYQMAMFPLPILLLIPFSLRQTVQTEIYDQAGKHRDISASWPVFSKSLRVVALLTPFFAGAVFLGMPMLIHNFLEEYQGSIVLVQLFAFTSFSLQLIQILFPVVVVKGNLKRLIPQILGILLIPTIIGFIAAKQGAPLLFILGLQSVGWFVISLWLLKKSLQWFNISRNECRSTHLSTFSPILATAVELPLLHWLMTSVFGWSAYGFAYGILGGLLHTLLVSPFLFSVYKEIKNRRRS